MGAGLVKEPVPLDGLRGACSELARDGEEARDLLVRLAQAARQRPPEGPEELRREGGAALHQRLHLLVRDGEDLAIGVADRVRGGRRPVEELDLAAALTGAGDRAGLVPD